VLTSPTNCTATADVSTEMNGSLAASADCIDKLCDFAAQLLIWITPNMHETPGAALRNCFGDGHQYANCVALRPGISTQRHAVGLKRHDSTENTATRANPMRGAAELFWRRSPARQLALQPGIPTPRHAAKRHGLNIKLLKGKAKP
jgi:hypothetical protein